MLRSLRRAATGACVGNFATAPASAAVTIDKPWTRATPGHSDIGAVFFTVTSPAADRRIAATSPAAGRAELQVQRMAAP
jgi:copper(I)-binding protein